MTELKHALHGSSHRLIGSDPGEIGLAPASLMGAVMGAARLSNGFGVYGGVLYLPDRDGPPLEAGEEIIISYSHFEPVNHFTYLAARAHILTGLTDDNYDYVHPWESSPWNGGGGSPSGGPETWNRFTTFVAVTNDDGEVVTWTFPSSGAHAEQYSFDDTGVGHIGYLLHDFSAANETGSVTVAYSGASSERAGAHNYNVTGPVTIGAMVGEEIFAGPGVTSEVGITLTDDVPAGSQLLLVMASKGPTGFSPTDAGNRPQVFVRLPFGVMVPKWRIGDQLHTLPEQPITLGVTGDLDGGGP